MKHYYFSLIFTFIGFSVNIYGQNIVINEFMASNDSLSNIVDEFGETDDWVELHNLTNNTIDLSGYGLSDDYTLLNKWEFPEGILIPPNGYLIVWTDGDDMQGDLHTNYKLNKSGERIALSDIAGAVLDSISYFDQETNVSMARIPNGTGPFIQQAPTFNAANSPVAITAVKTGTFKIYPTIVSNQIFIENINAINQFIKLKIYSLDGKKLLEKNKEVSTSSVIELDIQQLNAGSYFLSIQSNKNVLSNFYFHKQ